LEVLLLGEVVQCFVTIFGKFKYVTLPKLKTGTKVDLQLKKTMFLITNNYVLICFDL